MNSKNLLRLIFLIAAFAAFINAAGDEKGEVEEGVEGGVVVQKEQVDDAEVLQKVEGGEEVQVTTDKKDETEVIQPAQDQTQNEKVPTEEIETEKVEPVNTNQEQQQNNNNQNPQTANKVELLVSKSWYWLIFRKVNFNFHLSQSKSIQAANELVTTIHTSSLWYFWSGYFEKFTTSKTYKLQVHDLVNTVSGATTDITFADKPNADGHFAATNYNLPAACQTQETVTLKLVDAGWTDSVKKYTAEYTCGPKAVEPEKKIVL